MPIDYPKSHLTQQLYVAKDKSMFKSQSVMTTVQAASDFHLNSWPGTFPASLWVCMQHCDLPCWVEAATSRFRMGKARGVICPYAIQIRCSNALSSVPNWLLTIHRARRSADKSRQTFSNIYLEVKTEYYLLIPTNIYSVLPWQPGICSIHLC